MKSSLVFDKMNAISDTTSIIKLLVCLYIKIGRQPDEQIWFSVFEGWNEKK